MFYLAIIVIIVLLWVLNLIIGICVGKILTNESQYFHHIISNGNNIFYQVFAIIGIAIAYHFFAFIKWIIIAYEVVFGGIQIVILIISIVSTIIIRIQFHKQIPLIKDEIKTKWKICRENHELLEDEEEHPVVWLVILSNLIEILSNVIIIIACYIKLF